MPETEEMITIDQALERSREFYNTKEFERSLELIARILQHNPNNIESKYIAALCYTELENYELAERLFADCHDVVKDSADLYFSIALLFEKQGRTQETMQAYHKVLSLNSKHIGALNNLANIYNCSGNNALALEYFNKILEIDGESHIVYNNISLIYKKAGLLQNALQYVLKAIEIDPDGLEQNHNAALIYMSMANNKKAIEYYRKAYKVNPGHFHIVKEYYDILGKVCDWEAIEKLKPIVEKLEKQQKPGIVVPIMTDVQKNADPKNYLKTVREFTNKIVKDTVKLYPQFTFDKSRFDRSKNKIKIGYMSSDIKDHPVAHLMRGVFKNHDKSNFEVYLYSFSSVDASGYKEKIESYVDKFYDIRNISNYDTAKLINNDGIDILIDLNGHTGSSRIDALALKPAPVQVNYLGYIGSMGADFMDYVIVDKRVAPPEEQVFYDEKFVYMPDCYQANDHDLEVSDEKITKADEGLPEDKFIFCSMNQTYKIEPVMFDVWMNILKKVPNSVLWLYKGSIYEDDNLAVENLRKEAKKRDIDPNRLFFAKPEKIGKHLKRTSLADIALDTRLYNGGTVTSQTLWVDVPVLTLKGNHFASRMATSILSSVGLSELITTSLEDYENLAVELANNPDKVKKLKEKLEKNKSTKPLFDTKLFTRNLEKAYRKMWENYCNGNQTKQLDLKIIKDRKK